VKIGFDLLPRTTLLAEAHRPVLAALMAAGDDGVEARARGAGAAFIRAGTAAQPGGPNG